MRSKLANLANHSVSNTDRS